MNVARAFFSLSSLTLLSRVSGFVRVGIFAAFYGRSLEADIFLAIMIVPELLYRFLSEGLIASAAVPLFVEHRGHPESLKKSLSTILVVAFWASLAFTVFLIVFAPDFCRMLTPGFSESMLSRMHWMWSIIALYIVAGVLSGVITSFLNACNIFAAPAVGPLIVNLTIIAGTILNQGGPVENIVVTVVLGAFLQQLWLTALLFYYGYCKSVFELFAGIDLQIAGVFFRSVFPVAAWISVLPFIPVYERYLLSMQPSGSVAALNYIDKLFNLPLGILSISLAQVILPELSELQGKQRRDFLFKTVGISALVFVPVILVSHWFAEPIVTFVFQRGQFSPADSLAAAGLFRSYAYALLPTTLCLLLNRGFFASRRYFVPFLAGLSAAAAQFWLGRILVAEYGVNGIGYAAAAAFTVQFVVLLIAELRSVHKLA
ncbi:MAG: lipid II flippase MurJ [Candidatus Riflebacteria bacterium]